MDTSLELKELIKEEKLDNLADLSVSLVSLPYPQLLDFLHTLNISKRVELAKKYLEEHSKKRPEPSAQQLRIEQYINKKMRPIPSGHRADVDSLEQRLSSCGLPDHVKDRVMVDVNRLKSMSPQNTEHHVLTSHLTLVADLPWQISTPESIDIAKAKQYLDESHDGMPAVKTRVLEHLAVRKLNGGAPGPILCLSGPPGIGKTSIARGIAEALGRKFERISLGGIRDESDIRGHRRTYVAAMPGRIIQAIKHARSNNPLILLDEVDKLFAGNHGSPSAALLEVLDPEQNNAFLDHYLNLPFDLSNVLFIATANDTERIEGPLKDRLEMIDMEGYSTTEKMRIAGRHIVPRQLDRHGICPDHLMIGGDALQQIVEAYTREAGVRQLERGVAAVCRHAALQLAEAINSSCDADTLPDLQLPIHIGAGQIEKIMGPAKFHRADVVSRMRALRPGTCFGMAWTPFGGELMVIETSQSPGKGAVQMTGKLGDVLRESVEVARSWLRANAHRLALPDSSSFDIHVHLPAGAIGKDGPSAGCALACALYSLQSGRVVRNDTAVTGEISLTGHVLPVGGVKEKLLGAHRAGIRRCVIPIDNKHDVDKLDAHVKAEMRVEFAVDIDDLLEKMIDQKAIGALSKL